MRHSALGLCGLMISVGLGANGCSMNEKVTLTETGAPEYQRLHIVYDVKTDEQNVRLDRPSTVQTVSHTTEAPSELGIPEAKLRLEVQYPYPDAQPGFAHVSLRVLSTGGYNGPATDGIEEILVIDVPKPEIDAVLFELARTGFFDKDPKTPLQAHVDVHLNDGQVAKLWGNSPKLDRLVGMLKSYGSPVAVPAQKPERPETPLQEVSRPTHSSSKMNILD